MTSKVWLAAVVFGLAVALAPPAVAQSTMIKGKVVDAAGKPIVGAAIAIEFMGGISRKLTTKTDKRGEFLQLLTESGPYKVTATADKLGSQTAEVRVVLGRASDVNIVLGPGGAGPDGDMAAALKKVFDEGVEANRAGDHDAAIAKFEEATALVPNCFNCYYNIGVSRLAQKNEKAAEEAWLKAVELKPDYSEALNALSTLYNNQKRFDEAAEMSAKAAGSSEGGNVDAVYNQGIILWNQGKTAEAKAKFEEAISIDANHADSHYQLGMALLNEGKLPDAVAAFENYIKLAPTGQYATQAKGMIAQLKK